MFTGIVEDIGVIRQVERERSNLILSITCSFVTELKVDQSIAHNGACLTVSEISDDFYKVTAVKETLNKTNLGDLQIGDEVNLERCIKVGDRLDGHMVQGHVDVTSKCIEKRDDAGSWHYTFHIDDSKTNLIVPKGSICINGVSLTVVDKLEESFSVAIIPYTYDHTNFKKIQVGSIVNIEFDIIGKYFNQSIQHYIKELSPEQLGQL